MLQKGNVMKLFCQNEKENIVNVCLCVCVCLFVYPFGKLR